MRVTTLFATRTASDAPVMVTVAVPSAALSTSTAALVSSRISWITAPLGPSSLPTRLAGTVTTSSASGGARTDGAGAAVVEAAEAADELDEVASAASPSISRIEACALATLAGLPEMVMVPFYARLEGGQGRD